MEAEEHRHQDGNDSIQHEGELDHDIGDQLLLVFLFGAEIVCIKAPLDRLKPGEGHSDGNEVGDDQHVDEKEDEEFAIPETDAVVDPRAVVIHVEDTPVAATAVMAPLWLENIAHEAITASFVLRVAQMEAPEDGHLPRVSGH